MDWLAVGIEDVVEGAIEGIRVFSFWKSVLLEIRSLEKLGKGCVPDGRLETNVGHRAKAVSRSERTSRPEYLESESQTVETNFGQRSLTRGPFPLAKSSLCDAGGGFIDSI